MNITEIAAVAELALIKGWAADAESGMKASCDDAARWVCEAVVGVYPDTGTLGDLLYSLGERGLDLHEQALVCAGWLAYDLEVES
jgi:hypothetical protein